MLRNYILRFIPVFLLIAAFHMPSYAITAREILEQSVKQNFSESFRIPLTVKTYKGKKLASESVLWLMGRMRDKGGDFFIDFDQPKESKGLRFLFQMREGEKPKAFMYVPSTGKTLPISMENQSLDLGAAGLTVEDIQGFMPKGGEEESIVKEEKVDGRETYMIRVKLPDNGGRRDLWVSKKDLFVIKSLNYDGQDKLQRTFRVIEFFKTEQGKDFPREEEITVPAKNIKIHVKQDGAVFGAELPDEVLNPETFGTFKWRN